MGFYPDVKPGDAFKPSAALENDVRHMINRINGFMGGTITAGKTIGSLCVKGYNPTSDETIAEGDVVAIPQGALSEDGSFPVATMTDDEYAKAVERWGIAQEEIGPGGVGAVLIMGAAIVPIVSETGTDTFDFVEPVGNGGSFKKSKRGIAKYVRPVGTDHALIFVGISSGLVYEQGKGVKITGGTYGIPPVISSEITGGTDIGVSGGTDGQPYVISYTGSGGGGGGGIGFPDYLALNKLPSGLPSPSESGQGIGSTYLLPVPAGKSIKYYSPLQYCVALFAVADGWDGTPQVLTNDTAYTTPAAGWVRISILDDGQHQNGCLRFYVGTNDWSKALPLYRCGTFRAGATGISSIVSGGTATISLTGGTGSVKIKPGNENVSISGSAGVIEISATGGGGGGGDENIEYVWFGSVPPLDLDDWIIEAEPNKTYNLYEEYVNSSSFRDYVYTSQWIQGTYGIDADDGGNILVKLPTNLSAPCMIKIYAWRDSMIVVIAPDGKHIIDDNGTNTDSSEGFSGGCLHVYVYQPNNSTYGTGAWRSQHHS